MKTLRSKRGSLYKSLQLGEAGNWVSISAIRVIKWVPRSRYPPKNTSAKCPSMTHFTETSRKYASCDSSKSYCS
jgi:hypothetical protein